MVEVAGKAGLNRESLYKALAGEGNPRFFTVSRVIKILGCGLAVDALFATIPIMGSIESAPIDPRTVLQILLFHARVTEGVGRTIQSTPLLHAELQAALIENFQNLCL
ncbi:MAG: hypothetical protein D3924_10910 [Candidatus Electrothrix sp. AR4]|nr:hypothetical protein [Candidatus Electrothrix sp. AR4]